ncbi:cobalt-precorrin 5A hydrolase [Carboxydothermus hydrogenoformans]|uniref:Cobalamin biosynthesis protein CbiG n=1 Tax=Carboxydothermus hydrogenoformans (strain ATCC BAA-161 / DSM 6008 / Z-2901) TaxID=246194 RepID=Q3AE17_CARHZ|nr:cobalt-precorrin 5A hydrolase [Carboxydothermus hydrogenoformans]ABB15234.1 cobalamin biosynthesis protein CbiG [Carboxydothermus hydrogenoformans Z-2901]
MIKNLIIFYFTAAGETLARRFLTLKLGGNVTLFSGKSAEIKNCLKKNWNNDTAFLFIGALGIAVRLIAPFIKDKFSDPAVVVADETGKYFISVLSGHFGGANEICQLLAQKLGGEAVITTATDVQGKVGLDVLARKYVLRYADREVFKRVNAALARGEEVKFFARSLPSDFPYPYLAEIEEEFSGIKVLISPYLIALKPNEYQLYPPAVWVGIGCRRGVEFTLLEKAVLEALQEGGVSLKGVAGIASIDLKKDETALLELAAKYGLKTKFFTREELLEVINKKNLQQSSKVLTKVGVGNVCEAAAIKAAGMGNLILPKKIFPKVSVALAEALRWWE